MTEQHIDPPTPAAAFPGAAFPGKDDPPRLVRHGEDLVSAEFLDAAKLHYHTTADGARIRTAYWQATGAPRGTILVMTGYSEFIEKYYETAADLQRMGFAVLCFDWRGQGLSTRPQVQRRGWVANYELMMQDVLELVAYSKTLNAPGPLIALAHSMGANVLLRVLQTHHNLFAAAAVTAPMLGIKGMPTWLMRSITHTGSRVGMDERYAPGAKDNDPNGSHTPLCSDPKRIRNWRNYLRREPLLITHGATWRWARESATSMHIVNLPANISRITTPVLIANAMQDSLVDPIPTQKFTAACNAATSLEFPTAEHEILQETDVIRSQFFAALDNFLQAHLPN